MEKHTPLSAVLLSSLLTINGCQGTGTPVMASADQAVSSSSDMLSPQTDAADPNTPGLVRYAYVCGNMPEKSVELPHVRFGATYNCNFTSNDFSLTVTDDRVPTKFYLSVPAYHGPGTYTIIAYDYILAGSPVCRWPSIEVSDHNCPLMWSGAFTPCCSTMEQRANALTCTVVVQQHSLSRVTGTFDCRMQSEGDRVGVTDYCPPLSSAQVHGSFDFGPKDCVTM